MLEPFIWVILSLVGVFIVYWHIKISHSAYKEDST
jgi:hypothetical protein